MPKYPLRPSPDILIYFDKPRSQTDLVHITGEWRSTIYKHMRKANEMGLIQVVGQRAAPMLGPPHTLWELTVEGVAYLEANDGE